MIPTIAITLMGLMMLVPAAFVMTYIIVGLAAAIGVASIILALAIGVSVLGSVT